MENGKSDVLVVEDDREINELIGAYVEMAGCDYHAAHDGESALRQAADHPPDLVVLDVMLPDLDGFEVCRRLKDSADTAGVPVVMLSALDREEHRKKGEACGAVAYMTKPFDPEKLLSAIRDHGQGGK